MYGIYEYDLQFWKKDKNVILSLRKGFLLFLMVGPSERNTTLTYDVAWDDTLTNIFHILKNVYTRTFIKKFLKNILSVSAKVLNSVSSAGFYPICKKKLCSSMIFFVSPELQQLILKYLLIIWCFYILFRKKPIK